ncbi:MAG: hypothetical protein COC05_01660 [Gammaproteobacteria bacterium]|nr:MAG: hypothetical protein COC05_01660 [Gammaproteobacteria bacterium]
MNIDSLTVTLRKRSPSEAIDLGFAMARQWFFQLWGIWFIAAFPVFIVVACVSWYIDIWYGFILFWWLKPLYEQPLLYILSRQIFSEQVSVRSVFQNYWKIIKPQLPALLLWRRLSLSRSFNNPVGMLENLNGKPRRKRLNVLHSHQSNASQWLAIVCVHLEVLLQVAIMAFFYMLIPSELISENFTVFFASEGQSFGLIGNIAYFIGLSIMAPFYVAAGFALYITRRTALEGWDIELAFKGLKNRLSRTLSNKYASKPDNKLASKSAIACISLLAVFLIAALPAQQLFAADTIVPQSAKATIEQVLEHKDFGEKTKTKQWVYVGGGIEQEESEMPQWLEDFIEWLFGNDSDSENDTTHLFQLFEILLWAVLIGLIVWLVIRYAHILPWVDLSFRKEKKDVYVAPETIMGMDVTPESIPDNVLEVVSGLFAEKRYREAMALLYRASLALVIRRGDVEIPISATEQECSQLIRQKRSEDEAVYFDKLTRTWVLLAYGNTLPSDQTFSELCQDWLALYGEQV